MRKIVLLMIIATAFPSLSQAQSKAMENLSEKHEEDGFVLMFYYSTLKMLIPEENEELQDVIYGIEKIKLLRVDDSGSEGDLQNVKVDLQSEGFEEAMTARHEGSKMIVYIKERKGMTKGAFFLMESDSSLIVLDLVGEIPIDKLFTLSNEIDMLTDARQNFLGGDH